MCAAVLPSLIAQPILQAGRLSKGMGTSFMRLEIWVALLASTAVHAGLLVFTPAAGASRDMAAQTMTAPVIITAQLKNTLRPGRKATHAAQSNSARATRASTTRPPVQNPLRFYPPEAVARGLEGEAILMLRLGADGALIEARIVKSSGHPILDAAALRAIRAAPRFGSGPREMLFPVTFALH